MWVKRALAVLTVGAFLTLAIDVVGSGRSSASLVVGGAFLVLATVGFEWVHAGRGGGRRTCTFSPC